MRRCPEPEAALLGADPAPVGRCRGRGRRVKSDLFHTAGWPVWAALDWRERALAAVLAVTGRCSILMPGYGGREADELASRLQARCPEQPVFAGGCFTVPLAEWPERLNPLMDVQEPDAKVPVAWPVMAGVVTLHEHLPWPSSRPDRALSAAPPSRTGGPCRRLQTPEQRSGSRTGQIRTGMERCRGGVTPRRALAAAIPAPRRRGSSTRPRPRASRVSSGRSRGSPTTVPPG